jgi:hypothetical protein
MLQMRFMEIVGKLPPAKAIQLKMLFFKNSTTNVQKIEIIAIVEEYLEQNKK